MAHAPRRKGVLESETLEGIVARPPIARPASGAGSIRPPAADEIGSEADIPLSAANSFELGAGEDSKAHLKVGDVLDGKYQLLTPLSAGGMGNVWIAHNMMLDIKVALKVLRVDDGDAERKSRSTKRLLVEARAAAKLVHPAIVRIIDFGETPLGNAFFVMELLDGEDLMQFIERHGKLSAVKAVRTLLPIAHGLAAAHAKNIVHRDLKPQNIFLAREEDGTTIQPKLIDFGIAQVARVADERITSAGTVMGSPGYMAPEQARGKDVDERVDVWGLCVVLYEAMTGKLPFDGKNYNALMRSIIEDEAPPLTSFGVGDATLSAIIARGLAKDPEQRWPSMRELGTRLAKWLIGREVYEDICGRPLAALWVRERSGADLAGPSWVPQPLDAGGDAETAEKTGPTSDDAHAPFSRTPPPVTPLPGAALQLGDEPHDEALAPLPVQRRRGAIGVVLLVGALVGTTVWWLSRSRPLAEGAPATSASAPAITSAPVRPPSPPVIETAPPALPPSATIEATSTAVATASARTKATVSEGSARPKVVKPRLKTPKF